MKAPSGADGVIGGDRGLPFTALVGGKLWHDAGAIGRPANDGSRRDACQLGLDKPRRRGNSHI